MRGNASGVRCKNGKRLNRGSSSMTKTKEDKNKKTTWLLRIGRADQIN